MRAKIQQTRIKKYCKEKLKPIQKSAEGKFITLNSISYKSSNEYGIGIRYKSPKLKLVPSKKSIEEEP